MDANFINLTPDNLSEEHLCCIIRSRKPHPGVEAKRQWLAERLREGHIFRKLDARATVFIEYAPLETAWVPVVGTNYFYLYCLWVLGEYRGKGYARALMEYCLSDAREHGKAGVCMLGAQKQKAWLSDQAFAQKFGFKTVDKTDYGYDLLALPIDSATPIPAFSENAKRGTISSDALTIYYDLQCPFIPQSIETVRRYCEAEHIPLNLIQVDTLEKAKALPCVFNNWAVFYRNHFKTVNLLDLAALKRILDQPS